MRFSDVVISPIVRIWIYVVGFIVLIVILLIIAWNFDPFGRRKHAEVKAAAATTQAAVATGTVTTLDHYAHDVTIIHDKSQKEADIVRNLPGAAAPLDPNTRAGLCASLSRLRDGNPACSDTVGAPNPAPAVP